LSIQITREKTEKNAEGEGIVAAPILSQKQEREAAIKRMLVPDIVSARERRGRGGGMGRKHRRSPIEKGTRY